MVPSSGLNVLMENNWLKAEESALTISHTSEYTKHIYSQFIEIFIKNKHTNSPPFAIVLTNTLLYIYISGFYPK